MAKGKIINFEWMCDYNNYTNEEFDVIKTKLISSEIDSASRDGFDVIVGLYMLDGFLQPKARHSEFIAHLNDIKNYASNSGIKKIYLISGHGEHIEDCPFDYFYIDLNLRMLVNSYINLDSLPYFNPKNDKFLFLTGMPNRPNRIGLLSKFFDSGLLGLSEWSFFPPWTSLDKSWCRNYLKSYTDTEYDYFLKSCERSFDSRFETAKPFYGSYGSEGTDIVWHDVVDTDWVKSPAHVDSSVYKSTLFSVVSEGPNYWADDNDFITEKSWRTFLHRHPFIFAGHPDQFRYLKSLGFKTFEDYLIIRNYAYIKDENERLDAIVKNTNYWLRSISNYIDQIKEDVDHNFKTFLYHVNRQDRILDFLTTDLMINLDEVEELRTLKGYNTLIRRIPDGV